MQLGSMCELMGDNDQMAAWFDFVSTDLTTGKPIPNQEELR